MCVGVGVCVVCLGVHVRGCACVLCVWVCMCVGVREWLTAVGVAFALPSS